MITGIVVVVMLLALISVPLALTSLRLAKIREVENCVRDKVDAWGEPQGWKTRIVVAKVDGTDSYEATITVTGQPPFPTEGDLPERSNVCDVDKVNISFFPEQSLQLDRSN